MLQPLLLLLYVSTASCLKHSYFTKNDERSLIGPLGYPFGFTDTGHFNLTVFDFDLSIGAHEWEGDDEFRQRHLFMDSVRGVGFVLKRFKDEADFHHYMNWLAADASRCAFDSYLEDRWDDDVFDGGDDDLFDEVQGEFGDGEILDATVNGVFLSMAETSRRGSATPSVSYDFHKGEEGLYFLIYQICPPPKIDTDIHTRFELDISHSNLDVFGNESYLSSGEMVLPHMFFYFSLLYAICLYLWVTNIRKIQRGEFGHWSQPGPGRPVVFPIHHLMTAVLVLKTCAIFFESIRYHYLRVTGHAVLWSAVYYTFAFLKGTFLFTVILLIGSGWSFVKPFLSDREKKMAFAILGLQVINNIAIVVLTQETEGEHSFDSWTSILHVVDILCCCAVLLPIVWQVNALEKNMEQSNGDHNDQEGEGSFINDTSITEDELEEIPLDTRPQNGRLAAKLKLFRSFYLLVVAYIYITRIVVYLFATLLDYRHQWLRYFVVEVVSLGFYVTIGSMFRPLTDNPYLSVGKGDDMKGRIRQAELELTS